MKFNKNTDWFMEAKWGVFTHYLTGKDTTAEEWNERVDRFDVEGLAKQLDSVGAKYYFMTIGQNSGHYCSPNATYDSIVGIVPSKCSKRDLISDIADALREKGIKMMVYIPSGAPAHDPEACQKLEWEWGFEGGMDGPNVKRTGKRLAEFQRKWEAVIREWSQRWKDKVSGWWVDGCCFPDEMYRHPDPPNFQSFAAAMKSGNPQSIVAFNGGLFTPVISMTEHEDYTAGEVDAAFPAFSEIRSPRFERWVDGVQYHILSFLGYWWGSGEPRFPDEFVIGYTKYINSMKGVVTWDVPIAVNGLIPEPFIGQLKALSEAVNR